MHTTIALLLALGTLLPTPDQDAEIKKIESRLMAPCCYTQTIREHMSQKAEEMREEVTAMVVSGKSEKEIITYYKTQYGETILVVPDGTEGGLLTITPVFLFGVSLGLLLFTIRRSTLARNRPMTQLALDETDAERMRVRGKIRAEIGEE